MITVQAADWKRYGLHWLQHRVNGVEWQQTADDKVDITSSVRIAPPILAWGITVTLQEGKQYSCSIGDPIKQFKLTEKEAVPKANFGNSLFF